MAIRYLKIVLVIFVGIQGLLYVIGNVANWDAAIGAVAYVLSMEGHEIYSTHIFPPVTNPILVGVAFMVILVGEFLVGALSLKGCWDLWRVRKASAEEFNGSKAYAVLGAGAAMVIWFGVFIVIGGALFQMWQTQLGGASFDDAFVYVVTSGLVLLFVSRPDA